MAQRAPKKTLEELREERRRARWRAFWNPIITLTSIVTSVGMLMFFLRTCRERLPQFSPPGAIAPSRNQPASDAARQNGSRDAEDLKSGSRAPAR